MLYYYYMIINKNNNKKYIGITKRNYNLRFHEHIKSALTEHDLRHDYIMPLFNAIRKYGVENFIIKLLERKTFETFFDAEIYEGTLIKQYKSYIPKYGYNVNYKNEDGSRYYIKEVKEKIIKNNTKENNPFWNKKHSEETKRILSEKAKERFSKPENNPRYGYKFTEEDREKWRKSKEKFGRSFIGNGKSYKTLGEAAKETGLTKQAIYYRIRSKKNKDWYYI